MRRLLSSISSLPPIQLIHLIHRSLTEQQPGPLTESNNKGYWFTDPIQLRLRGYRKLYDAYDVSPIKIAIDHIAGRLFGLPSGGLPLQCSDDRASELLKEQFRPYAQFSGVNIFADLSRIDDFLTNCGRSLLLVGRVFHKVVWSDDDTRIMMIRRLPAETMKVYRLDQTPIRFRQHYSLFATRNAIAREYPRVHMSGDEDYRGVTFYFEPDEMFFLEWSLDGDKYRGVSPAKRVLSHCKAWQAYFDRTLEMSRVQAYPELRDFRYVKAKYRSFKQETERFKQAQIEMQKPFRVIQDVPKTEYFDVWEAKEMLLFVGRLRQYLLDEFNAQIVAPLLRRNGIDAEARYVCDYELTNEQIQELFQRYEQGELGYKEVVDELLADRVPR
jgi:hypothetical protein